MSLGLGTVSASISGRLNRTGEMAFQDEKASSERNSAVRKNGPTSKKKFSLVKLKQKKSSSNGNVIECAQEPLNGKAKLRILKSSLDNGDKFLESDDEGEINRIGSVPLQWYQDYDHVGYKLDGQKIGRSLDLSEIARLFRDADDPDAWKTTTDIKNQTTSKLTPTDIEVIRRIRQTAFPLVSFDPYGPESIVDFENPDAKLHPTSSSDPPKRRFLPSISENKKINILVKLIRQGRIRPEPLEKPEVYDLWGNSILTEITNSTRSRVRGPPPLPAPKLTLPGHAESYNPPDEYLPTEEEERQWKENDPDCTELAFLPRKYNCLRHVPLYPDNIRDRFERCLDLYLCPRALKTKMNVDPDSLLPHLPDLKNMKPFPSGLSVQFNSAEVASVRQLSFDASGSYLAVGRANGVLEIFDVIVSRRLVRWKFPEEEGIMCLAFNPRLPILAIGQGPITYIVVLRLPSFGEDLSASDTIAKRGGSDSSKKRLCIPSYWDILEALRIMQAEQNEFHSSDSLDVWCRLEPLEIGELVLAGWKIHHKSNVNYINWHPRGHYFTTVSSSAPSPSLQLGIHSFAKMKTIRPLRKNGGGKVQRAVFHPFKSWLFVAYYKSVRLYNLQNNSGSGTSPSPIGGLVKKLTGVDDITDLGVHPSGDHIILGGLNRRLTWFDLDLGERPYKIFRHHKAAITTIGFHTKYPLMFSGAADGAVDLFYSKVFTDLMTSPTIVPLKRLRPSDEISPAPSAILHCQWHPSQPWLAVALKSGQVGMYA